MLRRGLVAVAVLATLLAIFYTEENWRGKRAWENYRREWEAKGEKFDLKDFIPPPVPDSQNFAMTPFLAPLFDYNPSPLKPGQSVWRDTNAYNRSRNFADKFPLSHISASWRQGKLEDLEHIALVYQQKTNHPQPPNPPISRDEAARTLLVALQEFRPVLDEVRDASQRPYARFNISYQESDPSGILLPHLAACKKLAQLFELRASAELALGHSDEALADTKTLLQIADSFKDEPFLISGLVRIALLQISLQPVWEGLAQHRWTDAQLAELEDRLAKYDLAADCARTIRGERALSNTMIDFLSGNRAQAASAISEAGQRSFRPTFLIPGGFFYQNKVYLNGLYQKFLLPGVDGANHQFHPDHVGPEIEAALTKELQGGFSPYKVFARLLLPAVAKTQLKHALAQVSLDVAVIACALERHRLANGGYPNDLTVLTTRYLKTVPKDAVNGEAYKYRRNTDATFVLYSVGWNMKDDGGTVGMTTGRNPSPNTAQGDWVWPPYPEK
jgi:hypothetical protein